MALALAVLATGCGSDEQATGEGSVTIQHKFGETTIDGEPERVVAVGFNDQDFALALGVKPVGVRQFQGGIDITGRPWAQDELGGASPEIIGAEELDYERIAALRPDLILVERQVAEAREAHPEFEGGSFVLAAVNGGKVYVSSSEDLRSRFFESLGFETPAEVDELTGESFFAEGLPLAGRMKAVKEGRVVYLDQTGDFANALGFSSALSLPYVLDAGVPAVADAVDGDPGTEVQPFR
jgi:iron complex transport system substrate-binding protein